MVCVSNGFYQSQEQAKQGQARLENLPGLRQGLAGWHPNSNTAEAFGGEGKQQRNNPHQALS